MTTDITLAVLSATGEAGHAVVKDALVRGYTVHALARTPSKLTITHPSLKVIEGVAGDIDVVRDLLTGCTVAISTIGPGFDKDVAKKMVSTTATKSVIQAMSDTPNKRYIVMTGASLITPIDRPRGFANRVTRHVFPFLLGDILRDKFHEYDALKASSLDWTLIRCPRMKSPDRPSKLLIEDTKHSTLWVERTALAAWLVDQVDSDQYVRACPFASSKFL